MSHPPVLVVGAGPCGLIAAITLRKNGVPVRIIERREGLHGAIRGTAVQPRMLEILESLGLLQDVQAISTPPFTIAVHGIGNEVLSHVVFAEESEASPGTPYLGMVNVSQAELEKVLRRHLELIGANVEMGVEMVALEQDKEKVTVTFRTKEGESTEQYNYVVAADGTRGPTRKLLDIPFIGKSKEEDTMIVANVECTDIDREHWHRWGEFGKKIFFLKPVLPAPSFQVQSMGVDLPKPPPDNTENLQKMFEDISKCRDIKLQNASWISEWRANIRMASKFAVGRVFLVGDSAHCHSPAGGQGTNTGVTDALNLAWKLALVFKGLASPTLLDTYESERMPIVAEMLNVTDKLHHLAWTEMPPSTLESGGQEAQANDPMWRPKHLLQLGVNYRWSRIVLEGRETEKDRGTVESNPYGVAGARLRAGDRAPDAPNLVETPSGDRMRLFAVLAGGNVHTVLVFLGQQPTDIERDIQAMAKYRDAGVASIAVIYPRGFVPKAVAGSRCFEDTGGHAYDGYELGEDSVTYVVVRPDGMIGAYAKTVEQLFHFFTFFMLN
ncbi:FAD/NAD-P-binding domain-containing protein [Artomyces pyxidatus]|uniref:FAD/NAD-P-binding domain-containing protein n=1 Tax=Artomyces pyxidatus TaxID=48021 RepID=A0ACB8TB64_9AGAM|nr:FAD/NAD-P-binding domain-containing protein [Artomyces pyxidatus]